MRKRRPVNLYVDFFVFLEANQRRNTCFWLCLLYNPPLHKLYVNFLPKKEKKKF